MVRGLLLEENGFELPVPRENDYRSESSGFVYLPEIVRVSSKDLPTLGTEVSNLTSLQRRVMQTIGSSATEPITVEERCG